ncbi:MAG: DNRLRE domain-containing protein [Firmicutes bacterium]|nr:DNRLRE domain-containing protein [Bacillota bacterium]
MTVRLPKKILALLLSVCLILPTLSAAASAAETDTGRTEITGMTGDTAQTTITEEAALSETVFQLDADCRILSYVDEAVFREADHIARLNEEETLSTYVFLNRDGTKTVYYMDEEVKYLDSDGTVREKDLSLTADLNGYTTAQNDISLTLPENLSEGVGLSYAGYDISLIPQITTARVTGPQVNGNAVGYQNCFGNGTVLVYTPTLSGLKEDIMLVAYTGVSSFEFLLNTDGLGLYQEDGRYYLSASPTAELRIRLGDIVAFDATGSFSVGSMAVTTITERQQYRLTVSVDPAFLADPNTVYPVSIDPSITVSDNTHGAGAIEDASIYQGAPTLNTGSWQYAHCGYVDSTYKVGRILIRPKKLLSDSTYQSVSASQIESAYFYIWETSGTSAQTINLYSLSGSTSWTESGVTWNNAGVTQGTKYASASPGSNAKASFNITSLVKAWKNNQVTANCGFMLISSNETSVDKAFCTSEYETTSTRPYVVVEYQIGSGESFETAERVYFDSSITIDIQQANKLKYLKFIPTISGTYLFCSTNASGDPILRVYDSTQNLLYSNDNGGGSPNFRLSISLTAGRTYYLVAGHADSKTGSYSMFIMQKAGIENRFYRLRNSISGKYLDICGPNEQIYVHQWTSHAGEQEKWLIQKQSDGYFSIRSQYGSNKYVGVSSTEIGENNVQLFESISDSTRWNLYVGASGQYLFEPKIATGKAIYASNAATGTKMQLAWMGTGGSNIKWYVEAYNYEGLTFSAFDVGDSSEDESSIVKEWMTKLGYTNVGTYNNADGIISAQTIKDVGRYSDIVYINGHGERYANMRVQNSTGAVVEYLCADLSCTNLHTYDVPRVSIGAEWLTGSTTKTNSYWNIRTKWGILAQCAQLNYGSSIGAGNHWNNGTMNSAQMWARTMLGDGERIHGYVGYYNTAPGGSTHTNRLADFFSYCFDFDMSIIVAWYQAHTALIGSSDWAILYHSVNEEDKFQSMADCTASGTSYNIYYIARGVNELGLSLNSTGGSELPADLVAYNDLCRYPIFVDSVKNDSVISTAMNYSADEMYSQLQNHLQITENSVLQIEDNGRILYMGRNHEWGASVNEYELTNDEAVTIAEQYLADLGLAPDGDYRATVSRIQRYELCLDSDQCCSPDTIEYTVSFYRTVNGIDIISDQGDGILIGFNENGVTDLRYLWRDIEFVSKQNVLTENIVTMDKALEIFQAELDSTSQIIAANELLNNDTTRTTTAYMQIGNEIRPVYAFSSDAGYANCIFVDVLTGEVLSIDQI